HMTSDRIARMLSEAYGEPIAPEPSSILSAVRARLRPQFLAAKVGVTGANIGVAETGSIVVETNEGNGRLVTSVPKVHIALIGLIYPGPIGSPWTANVHGLEEASFAHLCVSCGLCHEICPVDIDIPLMIAKVKDQDVEAHGQPTAERFFMASEAFAKVACLSAPLANRLLRRGSLRVLMEWAVGVDRRRTLPAFAHRTLRSRFRAREGQVGRVGKVAFFPDLYAEYNNPDQGLRAIEILE